MVMLSAHSVLVAGSIADGANMRTQKVKVVRPFWFAGNPHQAGTVLEMPEVVAAEAIALGKATLYAAPPPKPAPAPKPEPKEDSK